MIDLTNVADYLGSLFNSEQYNPEGLIFNVTADVNVYDTAKQATASNLVIPGLVLGGTGSYEPLQGVMVYSMPVNITFWGFACPPDDNLSFTVEAQKQVVSSVVEALNGTTQTFGGDAALFTGATVTVGNPTNSNGGSYTRLPILVQVVLTVVENAVMSNDVVIQINGETMVANSFVVNYFLNGELQSSPTDTTAKSIPVSQSRTFTGEFFLYETSVVLQALKNQMLTGLTTTFSLVFDNQPFVVYAQQITETLRAGQLVLMMITFVEQFGG